MTACDAVDSEQKTNELVVDASAVHTLPAGADFIMCYSVAEGELVFMDGEPSRHAINISYWDSSGKSGGILRTLGFSSTWFIPKERFWEQTLFSLAIDL